MPDRTLDPYASMTGLDNGTNATLTGGSQGTNINTGLSQFTNGSGVTPDPSAPGVGKNPLGTVPTPTPQYLLDDQNKTIMQTYQDRQDAANTATNANRQLISNNSNEDIYYQNQQNQNQQTSEAESRRGFATNTALVSQLQDQGAKRVRDLEKQRDYLLLNNQAEGAQRIDNLIAQEQTAVTNARTQYIDQLFKQQDEQRANAQLSIQQQQAQREQQSFQQQTQDRTRSFDLQNGIIQPYYRVGNVVYNSKDLTPAYQINGSQISDMQGNAFSNSKDFLQHSGLSSFDQIQNVNHVPYSKDNVFGDAAQGFAYIDPQSGTVRQLSNPLQNWQPLYTSDGQKLYDARSGAIKDPATGQVTGGSVTSVLNSVAPDGTKISGSAGQCAAFAEGICNFGTPGNLLGENLKDKQATVDEYGISAQQWRQQGPQVGDGIIFNLGKDGHVSVVTGVNPNGTVTAKDSNFVGPNTVGTRTVNLNDPSIYGVVRGQLKAGGGSSASVSANPNASPILNGGSNQPYNPNNSKDALAMTWLQTGSVPKGNGKTSPLAGDVEARGRAIAKQLGLGDNFNPALATGQNKADIKSLVDTQTQRDQLSTNLQTADSNFQMLTKYMQEHGLNQHDVPLANQAQQWAQSRGLNGKDATAATATLYSALAGLQTEYSQILARGGQRNETIDKEAQKLIPGTLSPSELQQVVDYIKTEGQNVLKAKDDTISQIKGRFNTGGSSSSSGKPSLSDFIK